jgi:5-methylcytosine-specific restriction protein A
MATAMIDDPFGGRSVPEWIGSSPDAKVPDRVRDRIFVRHGGICHISSRKITPRDKWQLEHVKPLALGGEHRERNLAPAIVEEHKHKTGDEAGRRSKADKARRALNGTKARKSRPMPGSKASGIKKCMSGEVVRRDGALWPPNGNPTSYDSEGAEP